MFVKKIGLGPKIVANPKNPSASQMFLVREITEGQTLNDVTVAVLAASETYVTLAVPLLPNVVSSFATGVLYRTGVTDQDFIDDSTAVATVEYGMLDSAPAPEAGGPKPDEQPETEMCGPEFSFDTQGGTKHITQSLLTRHRFLKGGAANSAPNRFSAIGYTDGKVEGCDIVTGDLKWSVTLKGVPVTHRWLKKIKAMTGTVNDRAFYNRAEEELLFTGASGNFRVGDGWVVTFNFVERENEGPDVEIAPGIIVPDKKGHDYAWVTYEESIDATFNVMLPAAGYVERVYRRKDMRQIFLAGAYNPTLP